MWVKSLGERKLVPLLHHCHYAGYIRCGKKSNPLKLLAVFLATAWSLSVKFYNYM